MSTTADYPICPLPKGYPIDDGSLFNPGYVVASEVCEVNSDNEMVVLGYNDRLDAYREFLLADIK